jgi:hypothetical protein
LAVLELLWTGLYGFLLEWLTIRQLHAYQYGPFWLSIDGAPLAIGLAWAVIIYASMGLSNQIQLAQPARPILDALLALNLDLGLDIIAIRLGLWAWTGVGLKEQWFGVPWVNVWAWFIVVWSYSGFIRALRPWQARRYGKWLYAPTAMGLSLIVLAATSELYTITVGKISNDGLAAWLLVLGSLALVLAARPQVLRIRKPEPFFSLVPFVYHAFAILSGLGSGIFARQPILGLIALGMVVAGLLIHLTTNQVKAPPMILTDDEALA